MYSFSYIRDNFDSIQNNLKDRYDSLNINGLKIKIDEYFLLLQEIEENRKKRNDLSNDIGLLKREKREEKEIISLMKMVNDISTFIKDAENKLILLKKEIDDIVDCIPNTLDECVISGRDEEDNELIRYFGKPKSFSFDVLDHVELAQKYDLIDYKKATLMTGSRFSYFKGKGARLYRAIINFALDHNLERGYEEQFTPFIVNQDSLYTTGQLPKFYDDSYRLENSNNYLIPTAEVSLTNYFRNDILKEEVLPRRVTSFSSCFRKEAGAAGKYSKGTFRNHQFEKVELCCIAHPDKSDDEHHYMLETVESILKKLELPYRVMRLCSGDTGFSAKMCYDIEVWIPSLKQYMEISSISNCGSFQAHRGKIRFKNSQRKNELVHTLNGSSLPIGRTMIAILENYQENDGIRIPTVLKDYTGFELIN